MGWPDLGYVTLMQGRRGAVTRAVARIGATSYSVLLLHSVIIITLLDHGVRLAAGPTRFTQSFATVVLIVLPLTLIAARLGFNFIELPFLRRRVRWVEEPRPVAALRVPLQAAG